MPDSRELSAQRVVEDIAKGKKPDRSTLESLSDEDLMLLFQQEVMPAYDILVERFKDPLMNYIYRFVGDMDAAADILQDTFIRIYHKKHMYRTIARVSTWVYTIAGNLARSELRRSGRRKTTPIVQTRHENEEYTLPLPDGDPLPDTRTDSSMLFQRIQEALTHLPDAFREAVVLRDIQDLSYEEIAEITGLPIGTVKSRINRGRAQLQDLLKDVYDQL
jgi:RNA polymerase sigma-70 factor (ECF subfamily)